MNFEKITEYLDSLEQLGIPSVDCIISQNHKQLYRHMNGTVDLNRSVPVSAETQYLMFSMTKIQTMTAIMQLAEQGRISLDDRVADYLPAYRTLTVADTNGATVLSDDEPLRIRHLVSMQSGLDYDLQRTGILRVLRERGEKATTRELVDAFPESPLSFRPGEHFQYSLSHDVTAAVIEVVSGMSFGEYLKTYIWKPLGMQRTYFAKPMNTEPELAQQYVYGDGGVIVPMDQSCCYQLSESYESGGAGLISCTEDYAVLADALANGGTAANGAVILKPETVDVIRTNLLSQTAREDIARTMGRVGYGYGCGMQILMEPEKIGSPAPAGIFGWDGAAGSCCIMDRENGISLVFLMHVRNMGIAYSVIHPKLRDLMYE